MKKEHQFVNKFLMKSDRNTSCEFLSVSGAIHNTPSFPNGNRDLKVSDYVSFGAMITMGGTVQPSLKVTCYACIFYFAQSLRKLRFRRFGQNKKP